MTASKFSKAISSALLGMFLFAYAIHLLMDKRAFLKDAKIYNAPIVRVERATIWKKDWLRQKQAVTVYYPVVEVPDGDGANVSMWVDNYSEVDDFRVGDRIEVIYNRAVYHRCLPNTFTEKLGDTVLYLSISFALFFPLMRYLYDYKKKRNHSPMRIQKLGAKKRRGLNKR